MTSENKAPDRIWAWEGDEQDGWENAYATVASDISGSVEYVRADLFEASAVMASRQNALIDTLRDELAKEKAKVSAILSVRNELSWDKKTRKIADRITAAIAAYEVKK